MHPLPAYLRSLTDSSYLALAAASFVVAALAQLAMYLQVLRAPLQSGDPELVRPAIMRWVRYDVPVQTVILGAAALWFGIQTSHHARGMALVGPPVGAVLGSALPLQVVAMAMMRALRP